MKAGRHGQALALLLGLGAADVAALNFFALPPLLADDAVAAVERRPTAAVMTTTAAPRGVEREQPAPVPAAVQPAAAAAPSEPLEFKTVVLFRSGTFWVGREDRLRIAAVAEELRGRTIEIEVEGHADAPGSAAVNQRLSHARARAIGVLLEQAGVDPARIALRAFGEERPSDSGEDRRVEVRLRVVR